MKAAIATLLAACLGSALPAQTLSAPARLNAGDLPIDVDEAHAAPFFHDMDGDGLKDLLVGQYGDGKLRIYRNTGTARAPKFKDFEYLKAGGADARVPVG